MEIGQVHTKFHNALVMQCTHNKEYKSTMYVYAYVCTYYFREDCNKCDDRVIRVSHARQ